MMTESEMKAAVRRRCVWIQRLTNGSTRFCDHFVEETIRTLRYYVGSDGHGTRAKLSRFLHLFKDITRARHGNEHRNTRVQRPPGSVLSTAAFTSACRAFKDSNLCGFGGKIDSGITVPDRRPNAKRGSLRDVGCGTLVGIDGRAMHQRAVCWPVSAESRLTRYFDWRYFEGENPGTRLFSVWPIMVGDTGAVRDAELLQLSCMQKGVMNPKKGSGPVCPVTGVGLYTILEITKMLVSMRDATCLQQQSGATAAGEPCKCALCSYNAAIPASHPKANPIKAEAQIRVQLGTAEKPESLSKPKGDLVLRLISIRAAAGVKEVDTDSASAHVDLAKQSTSPEVTAALEHRLYRIQQMDFGPAPANANASAHSAQAAAAAGDDSFFDFFCND